MIKPVKVRIVFPRHIFIVAFACLLLAAMTKVSGSETVSVTLYYPPPIGAYQKMGAEGFLTIGPNSSGAGFYMGDLDLAIGSTGAGLGYGILLLGTNFVLNMNSCQTCSGANQKSTIQFMGLDVGWMHLVGGAAFGNVCKWDPAATTPVSYGALTPSFPWTWMGNGAMSGGTYALSPTGTAAGFWCRMDAIVSIHREEEPPAM